MQRNISHPVLSRVLKPISVPSIESAGGPDRHARAKQARGQASGAADTLPTPKLTADILVLLQIEVSIPRTLSGSCVAGLRLNSDIADG